MPGSGLISQPLTSDRHKLEAACLTRNVWGAVISSQRKGRGWGGGGGGAVSLRGGVWGCLKYIDDSSSLLVGSSGLDDELVL